MGNSKTLKTTERSDDLSKNNGKSVRYRIRIQQELEAESEIDEFRYEPIGDNEINEFKNDTSPESTETPDGTE